MTDFKFFMNMGRLFQISHPLNLIEYSFVICAYLFFVDFDLKKWLNMEGSVFEKNLKVNNTIASLFKSSIGKTDRFLKSGRV